MVRRFLRSHSRLLWVCGGAKRKSEATCSQGIPVGEEGLRVGGRYGLLNSWYWVLLLSLVGDCSVVGILTSQDTGPIVFHQPSTLEMGLSCLNSDNKTVLPLHIGIPQFSFNFLPKTTVLVFVPSPLVYKILCPSWSLPSDRRFVGKCSWIECRVDVRQTFMSRIRRAGIF